MKTTTNKAPRRADRPTATSTLTGRQFSHLQQILSARQCVTHPSFGLSRTEDELFGRNAPEVRVNAWTSFPDFQDEIIPRHKGYSKLRTEDEARLFLRYNYARYRLASLGQKPGKRLSKARTAEMERWYRRAMRIRSDLTGANLALVIAMAKRTNIPNVDFSELISEGNIALLRAIEKFDVSRGFKFSTYACRAILKSFNRLATKSSTHYRRFGVEFDQSMEPGDQAEIKRQAIQNEALAKLHEILLQNTADLTKIEQRVIDQRFALTGGGKKKTLMALGHEMGVSKERVRQIQRSALAKLRRAFRSEHLPF